MALATFYEIECFTRDSAGQPHSLKASTTSEAFKFAATTLSPCSVVTVDCIKGNVVYGSFVIFLNAAGEAYVRLLEHRGFYAKQPQYSGTLYDVEFWNDDGSIFFIASDAVISKQQALEALEYWLPTLEPLFMLDWESE